MSMEKLVQEFADKVMAQTDAIGRGDSRIGKQAREAMTWMEGLDLGSMEAETEIRAFDRCFRRRAEER